MELKMIDKNKIIPATWQPRETFPKEEIDELTQSIKGMGLIQPIVVRKHGENYQIIAGERRWRALDNNGIGKIPCVVREDDDVDAKVTSLVENWQRQPVKTVENERFIVQLYNEGIKTKKFKSLRDMANKTGISQGTLSSIINSYKDRQTLSCSSENVSWRDIDRTKSLKDHPETRKKLLQKHSEGKITALELENVSKELAEFSEQEQQKEILELWEQKNEEDNELFEETISKYKEIAKGEREQEIIVEKNPSEITRNIIKEQCEHILWITPAKINKIENKKYRDETIETLVKTEQHLNKLLKQIGRYEVVN